MLEILKLQFNTKRRQFFPCTYKYLGYHKGMSGAVTRAGALNLLLHIKELGQRI